MARSMGTAPAVLEAIRAFGLDPKDVRRITLTVDHEEPITLHVELFADATRTAGLLAAVRSTGEYDVTIDQQTKVDITTLADPLTVEQWQAIRTEIPSVSERDCLAQTRGNLVNRGDSHECRRPADHGALPHRCACEYEWPVEPLPEHVEPTA